jgi:hypothetical protein
MFCESECLQSVEIITGYNELLCSVPSGQTDRRGTYTTYYFCLLSVRFRIISSYLIGMDPSILDGINRPSFGLERVHFFQIHFDERCLGWKNHKGK